MVMRVIRFLKNLWFIIVVGITLINITPTRAQAFSFFDLSVQTAAAVNSGDSFFCWLTGFVVRPLGWCQSEILVKEIPSPAYFPPSTNGENLLIDNSIASPVPLPSDAATSPNIINEYITYQSNVGITENDLSTRLSNLAQILRSEYSQNGVPSSSMPIVSNTVTRTFINTKQIEFMTAFMTVLVVLLLMVL